MLALNKSQHTLFVYRNVIMNSKLFLLLSHLGYIQILIESILLLMIFIGYEISTS